MKSRPLPTERVHGYGDSVHILDDPFLTSAIARAGHPSTTTPELRELLRHIYYRLLGAVLAAEFPIVEESVPTRMASITEAGHWSGEIIDPKCEVVIACLVRAGVLPSEICYYALSQVLASPGLRIDYLSMSRRVDDAGQVVGTDEAGLKIGGPIREKILLIPDPMGATGGTIDHTLALYEELGLGPAKKAIALPMIATPEFCRRLAASHPDLAIWTGRLDRGLSTPEALAAEPGMVDGERGLTDQQYIVPGAGGIGELLTNSWV